ncbi:GWT1-domain-containing protein [Gautieria morchelliformis]|nr:GWT1-domain-containing protein [Gautieria morchelliformis]
MQDDYKASKEAFVSYQSGSTVTHINLVSSVALSSVALHSALRSRLPQNNGSNLITEFILLIIPLLLSMTVFANKPLWLDAILISPTLLLLLVPARSQQSLPSSHQSPRSPSPTHSSNIDEVRHPSIPVAPLPALTTYRTHMLVMTSLAILAVDFPVFPRTLAKCETFGVSLMDMGVGSFVFSQGIISAIPILKNPSHLSAPMLPKLTVVFLKMLPLIFLGVLRVILVKGTEYPEHESEYGTHWNFFITLAALPLLQVILHPLLSYSGILGVGVGITLLHQFALSNTFLQDWTLNAPRTDIISQNKEGLVSLLGYLAIHLLGLLTGTILLPPSPSDFRRLQNRMKRAGNHVSVPSKSRSRQDAKTAIELCSYAAVWWALFGLGRLAGVGGGVSRRLANASYVLWVAAYNTSFLTAYLALDSIFFSRAPGRNPSRTSSNVLSPTSAGRVEPPPETAISGSQPPRKTAMLLEAINLNGLPLFLLANVATGLVNLTVQTMYASDGKAMAILSLYAFGLSAVAWATKERRVWKM